MRHPHTRSNRGARSAVTPSLAVQGPADGERVWQWVSPLPPSEALIRLRKLGYQTESFTVEVPTDRDVLAPVLRIEIGNWTHGGQGSRIRASLQHSPFGRHFRRVVMVGLGAYAVLVALWIGSALGGSASFAGWVAVAGTWVLITGAFRWLHHRACEWAYRDADISGAQSRVRRRLSGLLDGSVATADGEPTHVAVAS